MHVVCEYELDEQRRHLVEVDAKHHDLRAPQTGINKAVHDRIKVMLQVRCKDVLSVELCLRIGV